MKETLCPKCVHLAVCSLKHKFLEVRKAADDISISSSEGDGIRLVSDIEWITVTVDCKHYTSGKIIRSSPLALENPST